MSSTNEAQPAIPSIDLDQLATTTGGVTGAWLVNHPYAADAFLSHHPGRAAEFAQNHPWANARMHRLAG